MKTLITLATKCHALIGAILFVAVSAHGGNNAACLSQSVPTTMEAGTRRQIRIVMKNTGTTTWNENGGVGSFRLGSQNPGNNQVWRVDNRIKLLPGESVRPNAIKTFTFDVIAPTSAGRYNFQWQMVHEGVSHWFGSKTPNLAITVTQPRGVSLDLMSRNGRQLGLRQMTYQGRRLLTGGGMYLICSRDGGADNPRTNFGSEQSRDGYTMGNDAGQVGPPFRLSFERTSPTTIRFSADIGPVNQTVYEANLAMDFDKALFALWEFDGTSSKEGGCNNYRLRQGNSGTFASIRSPCPLVVDRVLVGYVGIVAPGTSPAWWKVNGSGGNVKVTVNKATARNLRSSSFTRHPYTHNIGFGFGQLSRGQSAHLDGTIEVSR